MSSKDVDFKIVDLILSTGTLSKECRNDPIFHECVHELSALPMYRLSSESSYLRDCHRRIIEENYKLAYDNYATFIQTAECTKLIFSDFEGVETQNELLSTKIPNFVSCCNSFVDKCRISICKANMNSLTLKTHNQILEILEIPQLLEACIRNNYLDEALEMIAHIRKLERRHQNIDIVMNVVRESRLAAQKLLDQLFHQLGGNLQLPACLKIVGYLRRMDCLPDSLLRMKFLQCRDNYLKDLLHALPTNDPFFHATKYMEMTRVNLFDIATQYRAVFNDDDVYLTNADNYAFQQGMLFSSWLVMRVRIFMTNFAEDLDLIVQNSVDYKYTSSINHSSKTSSQSIGSKLQSLLGQSMYFGLSLSRIGSDFRGLLMPLFYQAITKYVQLRLNEIPDSFADSISSYKWTVNMDGDVDTLTVSSAVHAAHELLRCQKSEEISAPSQLMNHPLLAMLVNQMVSILEDIRLCCPRVLADRIRQSFIDTVEQLMHGLVRFHHDESPNLTDKERRQFHSMMTAFVCSLLPHVNLCLIVLFAGDPSRLSPHRDGPGNCSSTMFDIVKLSHNFASILPDSFFLAPADDDDGEIGGGDVHGDGGGVLTGADGSQQDPSMGPHEVEAGLEHQDTEEEEEEDNAGDRDNGDAASGEAAQCMEDNGNGVGTDMVEDDSAGDQSVDSGEQPPNVVTAVERMQSPISHEHDRSIMVTSSDGIGSDNLAVCVEVNEVGTMEQRSDDGCHREHHE